MALYLEFNCTHCDYSAFMAGEPSVIMAGPTVPVVCLKCKNISDRVEMGWFDDDKVGIDPECSECGNTTFTFWDWKKKPCPKCEAGTLVPDPDGMSAMVD